MINAEQRNRQASLGVTTAVFIGRSMRHSIRNTEALVMAIMLPIMLMLIFTYVLGGALDPSGHYVNYVVPGIIFLCAGFGSSSTAVDVSDDMTNGIIERFRTMPIRSIHVITGHVVASLARNLLATGVVIVVGLLVGFRPSASITQWIAAIALISLFILAFTALFAAIGIMAQSPSAASGYGFILLFLPYLSSAFVPTSTMPTWLQGVANNQPITPIIETIRSLLTDTSADNPAWKAIMWCLLILGVAVLWAIWGFQRKSGRR
jgi:ABC-2 type transport system permease protein